MLALYGHLRGGIRQPSGRPLTRVESIKSVGLFLGTAAACVGVALIGPTLLAGDPMAGVRSMLSYLGFAS